MPVRRRKSSAARDAARTVALARKSHHIVTNIDPLANDATQAGGKLRAEREEAEEERRLAMEEKAIRSRRTMQRNLTKQSKQEQSLQGAPASPHASHQAPHQSPPPVCDPNDSSSSGYEGGEDSREDSRTIERGYDNSSTGGDSSDTSDDDAVIGIGGSRPASIDLALPTNRPSKGSARNSRESSRDYGRMIPSSPRSLACSLASPLCHGTPPMGQVLNGVPAGIPDITIRILLLGDSGVGKTSLMMRYVQERSERMRNVMWKRKSEEASISC